MQILANQNVLGQGCNAELPKTTASRYEAKTYT